MPFLSNLHCVYLKKRTKSVYYNIWRRNSPLISVFSNIVRFVNLLRQYSVMKWYYMGMNLYNWIISLKKSLYLYVLFLCKNALEDPLASPIYEQNYALFAFGKGIITFIIWGLFLQKMPKHQESKCKIDRCEIHGPRDHWLNGSCTEGKATISCIKRCCWGNELWRKRLHKWENEK